MNTESVSSLTFVIVNYNTRQLLRECLESIGSCLPPQSEVIVVDNASSDGSADMVRQEFPLVRLIANTQNLGFPKAVNQGLRAGQGRYLFILNADIRIKDGAVSTLFHYMEEHPSVGIAAPLNVTLQDSPLLTVHHDVTLAREILRNLLFADIWRYRLQGANLVKQYTSPVAVEWITGAALFVRQDIPLTVGYLDENVFMYGEEYDWQLRTRKAGWEVHLVPGARVVHHKSASADQVFKSWRFSLVVKSTYYFYAKHHGFVGLPLLVFVQCLGSFFRIVLMFIWYLFGHRQAWKQIQEHSYVIWESLKPSLYRTIYQKLRACE